MTDTSNTETPPAATPPASVQDPSRRRWVLPVAGAAVVVAALLVGGVGGYALANSTDPTPRVAVQGAEGHGGPQQDGPRPDGPRPDGPRPDGDAPKPSDAPADEDTQQN